MSATPFRVLIIEDCPEDQEFYRRRIAQGREQDYLFWETGLGEEGLRLCREVQPDCILLDYLLPDLDGLEFLDRLQPEGNAAKSAIIMLTGHGNEGVAVEAMKKGADDYLVKGLDSDKLRPAVQAAIDKCHLRRQVEKQRRALEAMASERSALIAELQEQTAALSQADQRKDDFLAMLAHELRNPLAPIRNAVQLLGMDADQAVVAQARDMIGRQVVHMTRLVDDLLDASRIARGKIQLQCERLDLAAVVRTTVEDHQADLEAAGLTVTIEVPSAPVVVRGDPARLTQVIGNLLHNSHKFTDTGGRVLVRLIAAEGGAAVQVEDTGIGIAPEALTRLFEAFSQVETGMARSKGGLGLGLAVVRGLIDLHGGWVLASSDGPGRGSKFTVWVPLDPTQSGPTRAPTAAALPVAGGQRKVLIIEDGRDAAESLHLLLSMQGFEVATAYTGPDGLEAARRFRPDAVVSDLGLPGMSGFEVARALRADPGTASVFLVCVSGYGHEQARRDALAAGFDEMLVKPPDLDALTRLLARTGSCI